jgi:hypothetical protein
MAKLTTRDREKIPAKKFAEPEKRAAYITFLIRISNLPGMPVPTTRPRRPRPRAASGGRKILLPANI